MSDARLRGSDEVVFRRFADGDLERVSRMLLETPEAARYPEECSVAALNAQLDIPGHAPTRDRWVVVNRADPERLLAYCSVFKMPDTPRADMSIVTHPQARRQGIGAELLRRALADAAALGAQDAAGYINEQDTEALTFAARRGFAPVAAFTALRAAGGQTFSPPEWPAGATTRSWSGDADRETLLEAANSCYAGVWGHNVVTPEVLEHWLPTLDTRGVFFLFDASGTLIGMSRATPA